MSLSLKNLNLYYVQRGTWWCSWLRHCATSEKIQVWFPMVSLEFFMDIILLAALWPWVQLNLWQKWVPGMFPWGGGCKGGWCIRLTALPPSCANCIEVWEPQPPGTLWVSPACNGIPLPLQCSTKLQLLCAIKILSLCIISCTFMVGCW